MKIVVDKNIPLVQNAFEELGDVIALNTGEFNSKTVHDADVLIIRSETKVDRTLLEGSHIKFVGTATIGTDHIDLDYLTSKGIIIASAPGSNSNSVKEYIIAALLYLLNNKGFSLKGRTIGVVGVGNVGSKVVKAAEVLGMTVLKNDPPLQRITEDNSFLPLDDLLEADIITLHVPLTKTGLDPTYHLFKSNRFKKMKPNTIFINTARGAVVDTTALREAINEKRISYTIIDVWENEPKIDVNLLSQVSLGTPHIAGYSLEGKTNAIKQIREALCRYFSIQSTWEPIKYVSPAPITDVEIPIGQHSSEDLLYTIVRKCYDISFDTEQLRLLLSLPNDQQGEYFKKLRTGYRVRREFTNVTVHLKNENTFLKNILSILGYKCAVSS